jgi:outer membrane protein assembly factor BamB
MKIIAVILSLLISTATLLSQDQNLTFRGSNEHRGTAKAKGFKNNSVTWKFQTGGAVRGTAVIKDQRLFFGSADGNLYAVDKHTGKLEWKFQTNGAIPSCPTIDRNTIFFACRDKYIYALDLNKGTLQWRTPTGDLLPHKWGWEYFLGSPIVSKGKVYVGSGDGSFYCLDGATGKKIWTHKTNGRIRATPAIRNDVVFIPSYDGICYALDAITGKEKWRFETEGHSYDSDKFGWDRNAIDSSPALSDSLLVFGSRDGNVYALSQKTGKLQWKFSYGPTWAIASPAIKDNTVYIGWSDNNTFSAIDLSTGKEKWKFTARHYLYSSPLVVDDVVYVGSHDRNLYCLDAATGSKMWQYRFPASTLSSPVIDDQTLYIGNDDGNMYAFVNRPAAVPIRAVYALQQAVDLRLAPYLMSYGYERLDTLSLSKFLKARIEDKKESVVVFATDVVPDDIIQSTSGPCLFRQYLDAGGKVVWPGTIPNLYKLDANGNVIGEDPGVAEKALGVKYSITHDWGSYNSRATEEGKKWGLPEWWVSSFHIEQQPGVIPLAKDEYDRYSSWVKTFGGKPGTGFIQYRGWEVGRWARDNELENIRVIAEYGF